MDTSSRIYNHMLKLHTKTEKDQLRKMRNTYETSLDTPGKNELLKAIRLGFPNEYEVMAQTKARIRGNGARATVTAAMMYLFIYGKKRTCHICKKDGFFGLVDRPDPRKIALCSHACSRSYAIEKTRKSSKAKFGVENVFASKEFKENRVRYLQDRYGEDVTGPTLVPGASEKIRDTCLERYGVEHFAKSKVIRKKTVKTNKERYGVISTLQRPESRQAMRDRAMEQYGVDHQSKAQEVRDRKRLKMISKTEDERKHIQAKRRTTCSMKYGVTHAMQVPEIFESTQKARFYSGVWRGNKYKYQGYEGRVLSSVEHSKKVKGAQTRRKIIGSVPYTDPCGVDRIYYPDIALLMRSGKILIVEVKSLLWLGYTYNEDRYKKNMAKFKAAVRFYEEQGKEFVLALHHNGRTYWIREPHKHLTSKLNRILNE